MALFDNQVSMVSSHNFNLRSEKYNSEITALVEDKFFAKELAGIFNFAFSSESKNKKSLICDDLELNYPKMTKLIKYSDIAHRFKRNKI